MTCLMWKKPKRQQQDNLSNTCDFPKNLKQQIRADSDDFTLLTSTEAAARHVSVASDHIPSRDLWDGDATPPTTCNSRVTMQVVARSGVAPSWRNTCGMSDWRDEVTAGWRSLFFTLVLVLKREWKYEATSRRQKLIRSEVVVSHCVKSSVCETSTGGSCGSVFWVAGEGTKHGRHAEVNGLLVVEVGGFSSCGFIHCDLEFFVVHVSWKASFSFESIWSTHSRLRSAPLKYFTCDN